MNCMTYIWHNKKSITVHLLVKVAIMALPVVWTTQQPHMVAYSHSNASITKLYLSLLHSQRHCILLSLAQVLLPVPRKLSQMCVNSKKITWSSSNICYHAITKSVQLQSMLFAVANCSVLVRWWISITIYVSNLVFHVNKLMQLCYSLAKRVHWAQKCQEQDVVAS